MTNPGPLKTGSAGLVDVGLATLLAACGSSPTKGVASLATTATTSARSSAPAATGGGSGGSGGPVGASGGGSSHMVMAGGNYSQMLKFAKCMRSNGVADFPDPSGNGTILVGGTVSQSPQYSAADETCHKLLPNGGAPTAAQRAQGIAQLLKFSVCMRAHGISDYPDPTSNGIQIPVRKGMPSDLDPNDPRLQSAEKACQHLALG